MSKNQPSTIPSPDTEAERIEQLKRRRAHYKTPEFRDAITDAFHKAKLHALDNQAAEDEKPSPMKATR